MMNDEYHIIPTAEHYLCMVDLLGHAGCIHEYDLPNDQAQDANRNANACWQLGCFVKCMSDLL